MPAITTSAIFAKKIIPKAIFSMVKCHCVNVSNSEIGFSYLGSLGSTATARNNHFRCPVIQGANESTATVAAAGVFVNVNDP
jgi:hypothetical protein